MTRWIMAILAATTLVVALTFPGGASALVGGPQLPEGVTNDQALFDFAAGTATPDETMVTAQNIYYFQRAAGQTDAQAMAYVNAEVPAEEYAGASGTPQDLWNAIESLPETGAEAQASAGQLADVATSAEGDEAMLEDISGTCLETAGSGCAAAAVVFGLGQIGYELLDSGGGGGVSWDHGQCEDDINFYNNDSCSTTKGPGVFGYSNYYVNPAQGSVTRVYVPNNWQGNPCGGAGGVPTDSPTGWHISPGGYSSSLTSNDFPCSLPGVFYLAFDATNLGGQGATLEAFNMWEGDTWPVDGSCTNAPGNSPYSFWMLTADKGLPAGYTLGTSSASAGLPSGWLFDLNSGPYPCQDFEGNPQTAVEGSFVEAPSSLDVSFPISDVCTPGSGNNCVSVSGSTPPDPTVSQLAQQLSQPNHNNAEQLLCALEGCTDTNGNPVEPPGAAALPSCAGDSLSTCETAYSNAGFTGTVTSTTGSCAEQNTAYGPGDVVSQTPADGSYADLSSNLAVIVNPSPACVPPVTVPDCSGLTVPACQQAFSQNGFTSSPTITWSDGGPTSTPTDDVITTQPAYGSAGLPPDTSVSIEGAGLVIPTPTTNELWGGYQADLANAGITNVQQETLSDQHPWLDGPPNAVVSVTPAPQTAVAPDNGQTVTVAVNPDQVPAPSAQVTALANYLETKNPSTVNDSNRYDIAEQCLALVNAAAAANPGSFNAETQCRELPIFITGNRLPQAADHDLAALGDPPTGYESQTPQPTDPAWVLLNAASGKRDGRNDRNKYLPCKNGAAYYGKPGGVYGYHCDEYPFFATTQGVPGDSNLQYIDPYDNTSQGGFLNAFYYGSSGCNLNDAEHDAYLAVPIQQLPVKVIWLCNK